MFLGLGFVGGYFFSTDTGATNADPELLRDLRTQISAQTGRAEIAEAEREDLKTELQLAVKGKETAEANLRLEQEETERLKRLLGQRKKVLEGYCRSLRTPRLPTICSEFGIIRQPSLESSPTRATTTESEIE